MRLKLLLDFYDIHVICRNLKVSARKLDKILDTLKNNGYIAVRTHFSPLELELMQVLRILKILF